MKILLKDISKADINSLCSSNRNVVMYADFNVLNILYENQTIIPADTILYYDSLLVYLTLKNLGYRELTKIVSTDFQYSILKQSIEKKKRLFFFGDTKETLLLLEKRLKKRYPQIKICGKYTGYDFDPSLVNTKINESGCDVLFVGLGAGRQEKWITENSSYIDVPLIISVGGWFKYLAGEKQRAPMLVRRIHLEWLHKLFVEFNRIWFRYLIGAPKFLYRVFISKKIILVLDE